MPDSEEKGFAKIAIDNVNRTNNKRQKGFKKQRRGSMQERAPLYWNRSLAISVIAKTFDFRGYPSGGESIYDVVNCIFYDVGQLQWWRR